MKVAAQQEDLHFLAQILQEQLRAELPSGELFQVKCAVNNDQLMILTQHPVNVVANIETVFAVLEETLQSLPGRRSQQVELFLRVIGQKLPYTKHSVSLRVQATFDLFEDTETRDRGQAVARENGSILTPYSSIEDEPLDLITDVPDLSTDSTFKSAHKLKTVFIGTALIVIATLSCAAYFLTRPCVMFECRQIQTAKQLQKSLGQLKLSAKSEKQLPQIKQQLDQASASLGEIPSWSSYYQEAAQLSISLSGRAEKINQVLKAFEKGTTALHESKIPTSNLQELETRQQLWRQAIAPLEAINSSSELYKLVQPKLLIYRSRLQTVKQQMLTQEKWQKKLTSAKAVAMAASKQQATAKSLEQLQRVQSSWQTAVNALTFIPPNASVYQEAQKLLAVYKPYLAAARTHATKELFAAKTYNQAVNAASLAKRYEQQNQWQVAVAHWNQALNSAKQVAKDSMYHNRAQTLVEPYSTALKQAQEKLQVFGLFQRSRTDLDKTCYNTIRICYYTMNNQGIAVQLTPEYQQMLQGNLAGATDQNTAKHLQILQQALEIISDNVKLPMIIYDVQGNAIYVHNSG